MQVAYSMRTDSDCGPAALSAVLGVPYETIIENWPGGWRGDDRGRFGLPNDSPYDHFSLLARLDIPFEVVSCGQILRGKAPVRRTVVLLHSLDHPLLAQHWVLLYSVRPDKRISVEWGDGSIRTFTPEHFSQLYSGGWPACAYVVGRGSTRLRWYQRFIAWLTGKFI